MAFDVQGALNAGYSPAEVADFLAQQRKFDVGAARQSGYSDTEILQFLAESTPTTQNPFKGALGRLSGLTASGTEAVAEVGTRAAKGLANALGKEGETDEQKKTRQEAFQFELGKPLFDMAKSLRNVEKEIGYQPSTKLGDLAENPATVVPFIAERIITSTPDMAAAVLAFGPYVGARTKEILDERVKNDNKTLDEATVGDVVTATGAALAEATIERFATKRLGKGAESTSAGRRIAKETGVQSGTEAIEEGAAYLGETAGTVKGVDPQEMGERMLEGAIVGGGLGTSVQSAREVFGNKEAQPIEEVPPQPTEPVVTKVKALDETQKPIDIEVTEDPVSGDVIAKGPDGEEVDLTNIMSAGMSMDEAVQMAFGVETAARPEVAPGVVSEVEAAPIVAEAEVAPLEQPPVEPETALEQQVEEEVAPPVAEEAAPVAKPVAEEEAVVEAQPAPAPLEPTEVQAPAETVALEPTEQPAPEVKPTPKATYIQAEPGIQGNPREVVDSLVRKTTEGWKNAPKTEVVQSISDLPSELQAQIEEDGVNPKGAYYPPTSTVYMVADNIVGNRDAFVTLAHESIGHFGLRSFLEDKYQSTMENFYNTNTEVRRRADKKIKQGLDKPTSVEEVLAEAVEERVAPDTMLGKAVQALKNIVRQTVKTFGIKTISDSEVQSLLDASRDYVIEGRSRAEPVVTEGRAVFALGKKPKAEPTQAGKEALDSMEKLGRQDQPTPTMREQIRKSWDNATDNPKLTAEESAKAFTRFTDYIETKVFSSDAAANNAYKREIEKTLSDNKEIIGRLLSVSASQASHPDALANLFIRYGKLEYNPELYKYEAKDDKSNFVALAKQLDDIAKKYNLTTEQAERIAHTSFEAGRLKTLVEFNDRLRDRISAQRKLAKEGSTETIRTNAANEARRLARQFKYIHAMYIPDGVKLDSKQTNALALQQIEEGLALKNKIPELQNLVDTWNGIRQNSVKELVDSGLWTEAEADDMLSNIEYVPFYREEQLEKNKGPKEFLRTLQVQAKEKRLKGSQKAVADIFDNMARWTQYAIKRSVLNRLAVAKADALVEADLARKVDKKIAGKNIVGVWRDGNQEFYEVDDPLFMDAFTGLESVAIPALRPFAKLSNLLRQSVVLYPLFSVSQVPQDSFAAMFTSGLKTGYALRIPALAAKEFVKTLAKRSQTNKELERFGVVGIRDFTAAVAREDAAVEAGFRGKPGILGKTKNLLEHISMASDNAVRQAVYEASMQQGVSRAEALEKAFQLINFRAKGSSKIIAAMGQVIPFFNAYLAAQHVAIKTITGRGISPLDRKEALKTLAATTGSVMALSLIYSMLVGDDEDYENKPSVMRDRVFMVPGTKVTIPIRQDIFSIPKIVTEHTYMLLTDKGAADGRKFRDSLKAALGNALFSPTVVPQAIKPPFEVLINYNFFQGRPLIGTYQKGLDVERQFNDSTSQLGKLLGQTGLISPIAADHLIRGMFGSVGGLGLYLTNFVLHDKDVPKPEPSLYDMITALPGTSGFLTKENETGLKNDFYVLRDEVAKVANTINDIEARSPAELEKYFSESKTWSQWLKLEKAVTPEAKEVRADLKRDIDKVTKELSEIRREISTISNLPAKDMSAKEKAELIKELRKAEIDMLKDLDVKALRKLADL